MAWYSDYITVYEKDYVYNPNIIEPIKERIYRLQSKKPIATISVIAYNEERHLLSCLWSLSNIKTDFPIEILGVDNGSSDKTAQIFKDCGVPFYTEQRHSAGFARECGLKHSNGKLLNGMDGDTMYPDKYADVMIKELLLPGYVGVSSSWSYYPDKNHKRLELFFYENLRDIYLWIQSFKRPELSVRGMAFAFNADFAKKEGFQTNIKRGEDGSMALALKKYGKLKFIHNRNFRPVTGYGTLSKDGTLFNSFKIRLIKSIKYLPNLLHSKDKYEDDESNLIH